MPGASSERVLIFAPSGRDAGLAQQVLERFELGCHVCFKLDELCRGIAEGAGTAVIAEEAMNPDAVRKIARVLEQQDAWSDFPLVVLTDKTAGQRRRHVIEPLRSLGNVTLIDRPVGVRALRSTVEAALRSRRRQYAARKLLEEREALVDQLTETVRLNEMFVGILSHDLRNPLTAILTGAQHILHLEESDRLHKPLARIIRSGERMARMIEQLLDFTRARIGGGLLLSPSRVSLESLCIQVVEELEIANPTRPLHLKTKGRSVGEWDADRLLQVLSNLVANSLQHGSPGSPITVEVDGTDEEEVVVRVNNEGVIPPALLPALFDAFRGSGERSDLRQGLGLGLYITQQVVLAHGGSIEVTSDADRGTSFVVRLPRTRRGLSRDTH